MEHEMSKEWLHNKLTILQQRLNEVLAQNKNLFKRLKSMEHRLNELEERERQRNASRTIIKDEAFKGSLHQ